MLRTDHEPSDCSVCPNRFIGEAANDTFTHEEHEEAVCGTLENLNRLAQGWKIGAANPLCFHEVRGL